MKERYLDIMEKSLSAYTDGRIDSYIDEVRRNGLREHGFPRLGANMGILLAHGRQPARKAAFVQIMDLCIQGFAHPRNRSKAGNNFAIREVCHALLELQKTNVIHRAQLEAWKQQLAALEPSAAYTHIVCPEDPTPANWAWFAVVSEQARAQLCGLDATGFLEHQLPSQLLRLDENGMYRDGNVTGPHQPTVYDLVSRTLLGLSLFMGYGGKYAPSIEKMMAASDELTLKMQSVTGELAFGGRSNQCIHNEIWLASYCELRATLLARGGDRKKAGLFKAAAKKAAQTCMDWLQKTPTSHIKNHYDPDLQLGCEDYAYFNKYMITVASVAYLAWLVADQSIAPTVAPAELGGFVAETGGDFAKTVINAGGYFIEIDGNADPHYDAGGLGRVHKKSCDPRVCLSVPFPGGQSRYKLEAPNRHPLAICGLKNTAGGTVCSAQEGVRHILLSKTQSSQRCTAVFDCRLEESSLFLAQYTVSCQGVEVVFCGADGILLPVFLFDGQQQTDVFVTDGQILIKYNGSFCKYTFAGEPEEYGLFFNRNGRYRAYKLNTDRLHIALGRDDAP